MENLKKLILMLIIFFAVTPLIWGGEVKAAFLGFDQSSVSVANGATFQIAVTVNPGSDSLNSTDVYVAYDPSLLKATAVASGSLFPTVTNDLTTSGRVYIAGMVNDPASPISSSGTLATITFQGLKNGTGTLSFDCATSKIIKNDVNITNVIACSQNGTSAITVGTGIGTNPTSTPGELPQSGVFDNVVKFAVPGIIMLLLSGIFKFI